jgi:hypothetical protein
VFLVPITLQTTLSCTEREREREFVVLVSNFTV